MSIIAALQNRWRRSGLRKNDTFLLHSNITRTLIECRRYGGAINPNDILESLLDVLGPEGTLLVPTFNFDFTKGKTFCMRTTKSQMGSLTECARLHPDSIRTGHPVYSFSVIGYRKEEFADVDNISAFSNESPFGILRRMGGRVGSLDLSESRSMTFYHHIEEIKKVDYRYFKSFTGSYINKHGVINERTYNIFVRKIDCGIGKLSDELGDLLWKNGLYVGFRPRTDAGLRIVDTQRIYDFVVRLIDDGKASGLLYTTENL